MARGIPTGETIDWQNLPLYWEEVDRLVKVFETLSERRTSPTDLTARAFDEAQAAGPRVYIEAHRYLTVAIDNHEALLNLLNSHGATVWAPWSLIRPTFEGAFTAAYVLDPGAGLDRRRRGLQLEVEDSRQEKLSIQCFDKVPSARGMVTRWITRRDRIVEDVYKVEAKALGTEWKLIAAPVSVFDQLPKLSFVGDVLSAAMLQATWRMLSGYEHGLTYAALRGSTKSQSVEIPGGKTMLLAIDDTQIVTALKSTYLLFIHALRLYERRCTRPD